MFERLRHLFTQRPFNPRDDVDLTNSPNQVDLVGQRHAIENIKLGDYIQWSETSGQPGDEWYCGRTCYGIVAAIHPNEFIVTGIGYYGIGRDILACPRRPTVGLGYVLSSHGITWVIKEQDIIWRHHA